jgi:elongation factor G
MNIYPTAQIRNVVFVGHQGAGKTTLVEALLYNTRAISRIGRIEEKNTVSDWDEDERERGLSLSTSLVPIEFEGVKINILDTPGYTDFQGEVKNAIRVADSVIVVVDAVSGVEVGTELAWQYAEAYQQPIIVTINKLDRENADFERTLASLRASFPDYKFIPVMIPIGAEHAYRGVVNLLTMKAYYDAGRDRSDLPPEMADAAEAAKTVLVEAAAEADDALIEKYFAEGTLESDEIRDGMRKAARDSYLKTVPVFVTSGARNIGTVPLMEALVVYVSPPSERRVQVAPAHTSGASAPANTPNPSADGDGRAEAREAGEGGHAPALGEREFLYAPQHDEGPLAVYVFKTSTDRFVGTLNYFRIFSGSIHAHDSVFNVSRGIDERFGSLLLMRGKEQIPVSALHAGDIGVVAKLTHTRTGDALTRRDRPLAVTRPEFPEPLYMVAINPRTQADSAKIGAMLTTLCEADPTLRWRQDPAVKQTIVEGMGELHIAVTVARAERLGVGMDVVSPRVPYRETVTQAATATYRHRKQTGGAGQFAEVTLRVEPASGGYTFRSEVVGGAISGSFIPSIDKGMQVLDSGVLAGFPISDVRAVVVDGKEHPVDSKDIAFQVAGREAFKEAFAAAHPVLLEPIMQVSITVPEVMMGDILGDLNTRRARVQGMETENLRSRITALVPLAEMLRYGGDLRSLSGGRGLYTMRYSHHDPVPAHTAAPIIAAHAKSRAEHAS